jgi:hypothetical protein
VAAALYNPNDKFTEVRLAGHDSRGEEVIQVGLDVLSPYGQTSFLAGEKVPWPPPVSPGFPFRRPPDALISLLPQARDDLLQSFFLAGDLSGTRLDGLSGELLSGRELIFPVARQTAGVQTYLFVHNPGARPAARVVLRLLDRTGSPVGEAVRSLEPRGFLRGTLAELFAGGGSRTADPGWEEAVLRIESDVPLAAFEFLEGPEAISALAAQVPRSIQRLVVPHFFVDGRGTTTRLRLLNADQVWVQARITALSDRGAALAEREVTLRPGSLLSEEVDDLLGLAPPPDGGLSGHLGVALTPAGSAAGFKSGVNVLGAVTFDGSQGRTRSDLPLPAEGRLNANILHVAQSVPLGVYTGLALVNPGPGAARVTVRAFDAAGELTAFSVLDLPPGHRALDLLNGPNYFGQGFEQVGGHLEITSNSPIFSFCLFGDYRAEFLSAVEAQSGMR